MCRDVKSKRKIRFKGRIMTHLQGPGRRRGRDKCLASFHSLDPIQYKSQMSRKNPPTRLLKTSQKDGPRKVGLSKRSW